MAEEWRLATRGSEHERAPQAHGGGEREVAPRLPGRSTLVQALDAEDEPKAASLADTRRDLATVRNVVLPAYRAEAQHDAAAARHSAHVVQHMLHVAQQRLGQLRDDEARELRRDLAALVAESAESGALRGVERVFGVAEQRDAGRRTAPRSPSASRRSYEAQVQCKATSELAQPEDAHDIAERGLASAAGSLPHAPIIQRAFGKHDVSGIRVQVGGAAEDASRALGASAYARGESIGFASEPDLHIAAHEAAHVVQQRGGVELAGGMGEAGDRYEQHADAVADAVVRGDSAEMLLDQLAPGVRTSSAVQRKDDDTSVAVDNKSVVATPDILRFDSVEVGSASDPATTSFRNAGRQIVTIDRIWVEPAHQQELLALPGELELLPIPRFMPLRPDDRLAVQAVFRPQRVVRNVKAHVRIQGHAGKTPIQSEVWLLGRSIPARPENESKRELARAQHHGHRLAAGAAPATRTYGDLLAIVLAAQQLTANDPASEHRALQLLVAADRRLEELRGERYRLAKFGAGNIAGKAAFDMAHGAVRDWMRKLALGASVDGGSHVTQFRVGAETIRFLAGETDDARDLRGFDARTRQFGLGAAAVVMLPGVIAAGVTFAPAVATVIAEEAALLAYAARLAGHRIAMWAVANPVAASIAMESIAGLGIQIGEDGWDVFTERLSDPRGALFFTAQMAMDLLHIHASRTNQPRRQPSTNAEPDAPLIDDVRERSRRLRSIVDDIDHQSSATPTSGRQPAKPAATRSAADLKQLRAALPPELADIEIVESGAIKDAGVHVAYKDGKPRVEVGPAATPWHVRNHIGTSRDLLRYRGPLGQVRRLLSILLTKLRITPGFGTQGFEARREVQKLRGIEQELLAFQQQLDARVAELSKSQRVAARASQRSVARELAEVQEQLEHHAAQVDSYQPGRGFIAAESKGRGLPELPVAKSGVRIDSDERNGFFELRIKAATHDGREIELGIASVDVRDGAPVGAPSMALEATATYRGKDHAVHIYDDVQPGAAGPTPVGKRTSLTALAIKKLETRYRSRFGQSLNELSGTLTSSNKLNYQRAYATLVDGGMLPEVAKVQAVRETSFGAHRIAAGYTEFSVTLGDVVLIDLGIGWGVKRVPSTISVTARKPS